MKKHLLLLSALTFMTSGAVAQNAVNPFGNALVPDMIADASIELIDGTF